jgi:hypothetical protein
MHTRDLREKAVASGANASTKAFSWSWKYWTKFGGTPQLAMRTNIHTHRSMLLRTKDAQQAWKGNVAGSTPGEWVGENTDVVGGGGEKGNESFD